MKTSVHASHAAAALLLGLLGALAGCASGAVRSSTSGDPGLSGYDSALADTGDMQRPIPVRMVQPHYPWDLKRNGVEGQATLEALIDETGRVHDATVKNATERDFGPAALDALQQWTFEPGRRGGQPVPMRVRIPFRFTFEDL